MLTGDSLYPISLWRVIPNWSSLGKTELIEEGNKDNFIDFYKVFATVGSTVQENSLPPSDTDDTKIK